MSGKLFAGTSRVKRTIDPEVETFVSLPSKL
jgi:hypothetical protein